MNKTVNKLIDEIKDIYLKTKGDELVAIVLFGSYAKGVETPSSDIDLFIVLEDIKKSNSEIYTEFFSFLEKTKTYKEMKKMGYYPQISPIIKSKRCLKPELLSFLWSSEVKIIYDKKRIFQNFLKELEKFKKRNLKFHPAPIPHYEVVGNGK